MKTFIQTSKVLILSLAVLTALGYAQAEWNNPPSNPTANNAATPINVSSSNQDKAGGFTASGIGADLFCLGSDCISEWPVGGSGDTSNPDIMRFSRGGPEGYNFNGTGITDVTGLGSAVVTVAFDNPKQNTKYAVVCNGTMGPIGAELQLYTYAKSVDGFQVRGAHGSGADVIGRIDCMIY